MNINEADFLKEIKEGDLIKKTEYADCYYKTSNYDDLVKKLSLLSLFLKKIPSFVSDDHYFVEKFATTKPATNKKYN